MRYWQPLTGETVRKVEQCRYDRILLLPLYPHFSQSTTGSSYNEWLRNFSGDRNTLTLVRSYQAQQTYLEAISQKIDEGLLQFSAENRGKVQLVFSAHGTPVSYLKKGDPYSFQIMETIEGVMKFRHYSHPHHLCFQSKVGPMKWLEPSTDKKIEELAAKGCNHLLIIPISFVSDHVETLFELNIEYRHVADRCKVKEYVIMPGLNDSALFVKALHEIVLQTLTLSL
jgi:ferrochelatase